MRLPVHQSIDWEKTARNNILSFCIACKCVVEVAILAPLFTAWTKMRMEYTVEVWIRKSFLFSSLSGPHGGSFHAICASVSSSLVEMKQGLSQEKHKKSSVRRGRFSSWKDGCISLSPRSSSLSNNTLLSADIGLLGIYWISLLAH